MLSFGTSVKLLHCTLVLCNEIQIKVQKCVRVALSVPRPWDGLQGNPLKRPLPSDATDGLGLNCFPFNRYGTSVSTPSPAPPRPPKLTIPHITYLIFSMNICRSNSIVFSTKFCKFWWVNGSCESNRSRDIYSYFLPHGDTASPSKRGSKKCAIMIFPGNLRSSQCYLSNQFLG